MNFFKDLKKRFKKRYKKACHYEVGELVTVNLAAQMPTGPVSAVIRYAYPIGYLVEFKNRSGAQCFAFASDDVILDSQPEEYEKAFTEETK